MDLSAIKNKVAASNSTPTPTPTPTPVKQEVVKKEEVKKEPLIKPPKQEEEKVEKTYQTYRSGLENQKIIMKTGKVIRVTGHKYITADEDEIAFLDEEIRLGFPGLKKGEPVTETDLDPMAALRKRIAAEEREKIMKEIDAGTSDTQKVVPASTVELASLSAGSNSASAPSE